MGNLFEQNIMTIFLLISLNSVDSLQEAAASIAMASWLRSDYTFFSSEQLILMF